MSAEDVAFCQAYFRDEEKRDPSITELKMLDTYWSDHCRHTTFLTKIEDVTFDDPTGPVRPRLANLSDPLETNSAAPTNRSP
jgi:phosphoribosylformylglycinamidine synthase